VIRWKWYLVPFRSGFEEGSELAAMIILIGTMLPNSTGLLAGVRPTQGPAFSSVIALRWLFLIVAAGVAWPLANLSSVLGEPATLGHPSDWLSCGLFALSAVLLIARWYQGSDASRFPVSAVAFMAAASAICVQIDPIGDSSIFPFARGMHLLGWELNVRLVLLALCCLGVAETLRARGQSVAALLTCIVGVVTALAAGYVPHQEVLRWGYFLPTMSGVGVFAALAVSLEARSVASDAITTPSAAP
jgi:hypothetical protein